MSNIQNRLSSLQPYVIGVRFQNGMAIVDAVFKNGWAVPKSEIIESTKGKGDELNYHMFFTQRDDLGLDEILDYVEKVIELNIEREKKHALLKIKAKELAELFKKNPLSKLQGMTFVLSGEKLIEDMEPDVEDVVDIDFSVDIPLSPITTPQPAVVTTPQPEVVTTPQPEVVTQDPNVRYAPNGEIIPPLSKEDTGEIKEEFKQVDLTPKAEPVTKKIKGKNIDLPPKKGRNHVQLDEIEAPQNVVCNCVGDEVCPSCEEEKIGSY